MNHGTEKDTFDLSAKDNDTGNGQQVKQPSRHNHKLSSFNSGFGTFSCRQVKIRRAVSAVENCEREYRLNYFEFHRLKKDFSLITLDVRATILDDLLELDKCFYLKNYHIEIYPMPPPKGWLEIASLSRLTNRVKEKLSVLNYGDWESQVYNHILAKDSRVFIIGKIRELVHVDVFSLGSSKQSQTKNMEFFDW